VKKEVGHKEGAEEPLSHKEVSIVLVRQWGCNFLELSLRDSTFLLFSLFFYGNLPSKRRKGRDKKKKGEWWEDGRHIHFKI
jgi:hypothetical protein